MNGICNDIVRISNSDQFIVFVYYLNTLCIFCTTLTFGTIRMKPKGVLEFGSRREWNIFVFLSFELAGSQCAVVRTGVGITTEKKNVSFAFTLPTNYASTAGFSINLHYFNSVVAEILFAENLVAFPYFAVAEITWRWFFQFVRKM